MMMTRASRAMARMIFDFLPLGDAQPRHLGERVDAEVAGLLQRLEVRHVPLDEDAGAGAFTAEKDVLGRH